MGCPVSEVQPDMLGGKAIPASRLRKGCKTRAPIKRHGWADTPGSGPVGETCGSCIYSGEYRFRHTYFKCTARPGDHWKGGRETDIRPMDPACSKWSGRIREARAVTATPPSVPPTPPPAATPKAQPTRKPDDDRQILMPW